MCWTKSIEGKKQAATVQTGVHADDYVQSRGMVRGNPNQERVHGANHQTKTTSAASRHWRLQDVEYEQTTRADKREIARGDAANKERD